MTILMTMPTTMSTNAVYRIVYTNLLYFVVMFLVPLVVLLMLNGELIRVLRTKKTKRAQLLRGRTRLQSSSAPVAKEEPSPDNDDRYNSSAVCLLGPVSPSLAKLT